MFSALCVFFYYIRTGFLFEPFLLQNPIGHAAACPYAPRRIMFLSFIPYSAFRIPQSNAFLTKPS